MSRGSVSEKGVALPGKLSTDKSMGLTKRSSKAIEAFFSIVVSGWSRGVGFPLLLCT